MAGTGWESTDLLARFNRLAGRPVADSVNSDTKYGMLADADQYVVGRIAAISPKILYGAPTAMTTADGGLTYTYGTDGNGYALFPMGNARIYNSLMSVPHAPLTPGVDYLDEGTRIRAIGGTPIQSPLYWYGFAPGQQVSETVQSVLQPPPIRILTVIKAVEFFAESGMRNAPLADRMTVRFEREFGPAMTMLRKHVRGGGSGMLTLSSFRN